MMHTPLFPAMRAQFSRHRPLERSLSGLGSCTLSKLEDRLAPFLRDIPAFAAVSAGRRERPYSIRRTWWCFLWQMLQINTSCRDVVRQLQAALALEGRMVDEGTSGYCQARARLPEALLEQALRVSAQAAERRTAPTGFLQDRRLKVLDGSWLILPDTAENQAQYPQRSDQKPGCGFPMMQLVVVWSAQGGAVINYAKGDLHQGEMRLLHRLCPTFEPKDIIIYDRAAGNYSACALLRMQQADLISRVMIRRINWRKGKRLGPSDRLITWKKQKQRRPYLTLEEWRQLPAEVPVRVIRARVAQRGFRTRELVLMTTLLDPAAYPRQEIIEAYLRRWRLEMCLDDLKTTLGLSALRCLRPATVHRELLAGLIAYNLARAIMAETARCHGVSLERVSFKGTLDALRNFCIAISQVDRAAKRRLLWAQMLRILATDLVPLRPDRSEPRAVKRRRRHYPLLTWPRHVYWQTRSGRLFRNTSRT
jgi:hypothetical protein